MQRQPGPAEINLRFYHDLWSGSRMQGPEGFNTWALMSGLAAGAVARLEIGPGMHPRLPISGTHFLDISEPALAGLSVRGGIVRCGKLEALPFPDASFDLVVAFDVIEHVADDEVALREIDRVLKDGGMLVLSVPLHAARWTEFDALVGHCRRYDPDGLARLLERHALEIERSAPFGMQPRSRLLMKLGVWFLKNRPAQAIRWRSRVLPIAAALQRSLRLEEGFCGTRRADGAVLVCRRRAR